MLEPIVEAHADEMLGILQDPELYQFMPADPPEIEKLKSQYKFWEKRLSPKGDELWLNWAARQKSNGQLIGYFQGGVNSSFEGNIAYVVGRDFQRQGFAYEGMSAVVNLLHQQVRVKCVKAWLDTRNQASEALVKKLGMKKIDTLIKADFFEGSDSDEYVYCLEN